MDAHTAEGRSDRALALLLLRLVLGLNITMHGVSRLLSGAVAFAHGLVPMFAKTLLPPAMVYGYALTLPFAEASLGLLVLLGLFRKPAYVLGMLLIASLTFGTTLRQDWTPASEQLIYALLYAVLLATRTYDVHSMDNVLQRHRA